MLKVNEVEQYMSLQILMYLEIETFTDEERLIRDSRRIHSKGESELRTDYIRKSGIQYRKK